MSLLDAARHSMRRLFRSRHVDREVDAELGMHLELDAMQQRAGGLAPDDAERAARVRLGNRTYLREETRRASVMGLVDRASQDVRYGWRSLKRAPAFTLVAVISLGVGIGANTAIFGLIHALLLSQLPVSHPEQLISARRTYGKSGANIGFSRAEFAALHTAPVDLAAFQTTGAAAAIGVAGATEPATIDIVDGHFFSLLGIRAQRGRLLTASDDDSSAPVVVVSDRFWRIRLNADSNVIGHTLTIQNQAFTIVGVAPSDYIGVRFPGTLDAAITFGAAQSVRLVQGTDPRQQIVNIVGRMPDGMNLERAGATLGLVYSRCCADGGLGPNGGGKAGGGANRPLFEVTDISRGLPHPKIDLRGEYSRILFALMGGVVVLLLVACANVANLLLARASAREREIAVRLSLGASHSRLVSQLLVESVQLAALGAVLGLALAAWGTSVLTHALSGNLAMMSSAFTLRPDPIILGFTMLVSLTCGVLFGVLPALRVRRTDLVSPLKEGRRSSRSRRDGRMDRGSVAVQIALALVLVSSAALLVETLRNLRHVELNFAPDHLLLGSAETRGTSFERQGTTRAMARDVRRRVQSIPGVRAVGLASTSPVYGGRTAITKVQVPGFTPTDDADTRVALTAVTPGFFAATKIALQRGRDFTDADEPSDQVAIVNQQFVKQFFGNRDPIGQSFHDGGDSSPLLRIVGVVADAKFTDLRAPADPMFYIPVADGEWPFLVVLARTSSDPSTVAQAVARAIADATPGVSVRRVTTMDSALDDALARERLAAALAGLFGGIALGLAAIGLYGVMAYQVSGRVVEIGVRMALGANSTSVVWLVLRQSLLLVGAGLVVGVPLAVVAARAIATQLFGVSPYSVLTLTAAVALLVGVAVLASLLPARRAVSIDPLVALRAD